MYKPKAEKLNDFQELYKQAFGLDYDKHARASKFFGVDQRTCRRWFDSGESHPSAHRLLQVHCSGYLPYSNGWQNMTIDETGTLHTPYGSCTAGDIALLWRFKWSAEQSRRQLLELKKKVSDIQSDSKTKMLIHTADYLNRLVKEITGQ